MPVLYDADTKARVIARVNSGETIADVSRSTHITPPTIRSWVRAAGRPALPAETRIDLGVKVTEFLGEALEALKAISRQFQDPEWTATQNARDLGVAAGILADKMVRVLAAIEPVEDEPPGQLPASSYATRNAPPTVPGSTRP